MNVEELIEILQEVNDKKLKVKILDYDCDSFNIEDILIISKSKLKEKDGVYIKINN